jgi:hypothetical protein
MGIYCFPGNENQFHKKKGVFTYLDSFAPNKQFDDSYLSCVWLFAVFLSSSSEILRLKFD